MSSVQKNLNPDTDEQEAVQIFENILSLKEHRRTRRMVVAQPIAFGLSEEFQALEAALGSRMWWTYDDDCFFTVQY